MINLTVWKDINLTSTDIQPPAQINLLIMCEETTVQSSSIPIVAPTNHQTSPRCPQDFRRLIILSHIFLYGIEDTSTTERITITVEVSPTRTLSVSPACSKAVTASS